MRVLFSTLPLYGHFLPTVPLALALRRAGHDVLVATPAQDFAVVIRQAGLPPAVVSGLSTDDYSRQNGTGTAREQAGGLAASLHRSGRGWAMLAVQALPGLSRLLQTWRPDVVVSDPCEYAGRLAAVEAGLPWVEHAWGLAAPRGFRDAAAAVVAARGLMLPAPLDTLYPCPRSLQTEGAPAGHYQRFVAHDLYPHPFGPPRAARPTAYVSFGSVMPCYGGEDVHAAMIAVLHGLAELGLDLVLGVADETAKALRPRLPAAVRTAGWVSLQQTLPRCHLAIHHAGSGTTLTAVSHRLPQLLLPQAADQFETARALDRAGAAIQLSPAELSAPTVTGAAAELLDDPGYRWHSTRLADELLRQPGLDAVVDRLECLVDAPPAEAEGARAPV